VVLMDKRVWVQAGRKVYLLPEAKPGTSNQ